MGIKPRVCIAKPTVLSTSERVLLVRQGDNHLAIAASMSIRQLILRRQRFCHASGSAIKEILVGVTLAVISVPLAAPAEIL